MLWRMRSWSRDFRFRRLSASGGLHAFHFSNKKACWLEQACGGCHGLFARDDHMASMQQMGDVLCALAALLPGLVFVSAAHRHMHCDGCALDSTGAHASTARSSSASLRAPMDTSRSRRRALALAMWTAPRSRVNGMPWCSNVAALISPRPAPFMWVFN